MTKFYISILLIFINFAFYSQGNPCENHDAKYEKKFSKALSEKDPNKRLEKLEKVAVDFPAQAKTYFYLANIANRDAQTLLGKEIKKKHTTNKKSKSLLPSND